MELILSIIIIILIVHNFLITFYFENDDKFQLFSLLILTIIVLVHVAPFYVQISLLLLQTYHLYTKLQSQKNTKNPITNQSNKYKRISKYK